MTLDEAIEHAQQVAKTCDNSECAADHIQLAKWLTELKTLRTANVKLTKELDKWERLAAGIDLPKYPVTQFKPKDLERENARLRQQLADVTESMGRVDERCAKLRELVRDLWHLLYDWLFKAHEVPYDELKAVSDRMRELGIEVDDAG